MSNSSNQPNHSNKSNLNKGEKPKNQNAKNKKEEESSDSFADLAIKFVFACISFAIISFFIGHCSNGQDEEEEVKKESAPKTEQHATDSKVSAEEKRENAAKEKRNEFEKFIKTQEIPSVNQALYYSKREYMKVYPKKNYYNEGEITKEIDSYLGYADIHAKKEFISVKNNIYVASVLATNKNLTTGQKKYIDEYVAYLKVAASNLEEDTVSKTTEEYKEAMHAIAVAGQKVVDSYEDEDTLELGKIAVFDTGDYKEALDRYFTEDVDTAETYDSETSNNTGANTVTDDSSDVESFDNCDSLNATYPNGVPSTHPAYSKKLERDGDLTACERN